MFYLDRNTLLTQAGELKRSYAKADPFPHVVIDDFLPAAVAQELVEAFPQPDPAWQNYDNVREKKFALADVAAMPVPIRHVMQQLNDQVFVEFLEQLTGIKGLVADPTLYGGGLHQITAGGMLKIHADFNLHPTLHLQRRLNALLYLNDSWDESWGGQLELWDTKMHTMRRQVFPVANRLVIFSTRSDSFHGHPDPLMTPEGRFRRSMAWYYYTAPEEDMREAHSTLFQSRPGENLPITKSSGRTMKSRAKRWLPPAMVDAAKKMRS
jgi:Rps23 Pro-64 3,4-dihydroxylase Tpa1-like proline 4-hydroxylase